MGQIVNAWDRRGVGAGKLWFHRVTSGGSAWVKPELVSTYTSMASQNTDVLREGTQEAA